MEILLLEKNQLMAKALIHGLQERGFEVFTPESYQDYGYLFEQISFSAMIIDAETWKEAFEGQVVNSQIPVVLINFPEEKDHKEWSLVWGNFKKPLNPLELADFLAHKFQNA